MNGCPHDHHHHLYLHQVGWWSTSYIKKPSCISVVFWIIFDVLFDIITVQEGFASKVCGTDSKSIAAEDGAWKYSRHCSSSGAMVFFATADCREYFCNCSYSLVFNVDQEKLLTVGFEHSVLAIWWTAINIVQLLGIVSQNISPSAHNCSYC